VRAAGGREGDVLATVGEDVGGHVQGPVGDDGVVRPQHLPRRLRGETTTVGTCPRRRSTTSPYLCASARIAWCGSAPSKQCRFPMTGSGRGPGGRFKAPAAPWREAMDFVFSLRSTATPARRQSRAHHTAGVVSAITTSQVVFVLKARSYIYRAKWKMDIGFGSSNQYELATRNVKDVVF